MLQSGLCPKDFCWHWRCHNATLEFGCKLRLLGLRCSRDLGLTYPPPHETYDMFDSRWCDQAREKLPTRQTRDYFFPPEYDRKAWRRKRYARRERGRLREHRDSPGSHARVWLS